MMRIKLPCITTSSTSYKSTQDDTWLGQWVRFGHDGRIGTCGHGKTNKKDCLCFFSIITGVAQLRFAELVDA